MTDPVADHITDQFNSLNLKEPPTPPYSQMLRNSGLHTRSNSYSFDSVYDGAGVRPRAYSSSVFDFPKSQALPPFQSRSTFPITPKQGRNVLYVPGQITPPELSPYSAHSVDSFYSPQTPRSGSSASVQGASLQGTSLGALQSAPLPSAPLSHSHSHSHSRSQFGPPISRAPGAASVTSTPSAAASTPSAAPASTAANGALGSPAQIYALCKDQKGCRILQHKLQDGDPAVIDSIFEATVPHFTSLMVDPFGNYFCQKLVEVCAPPQILHILQTIRSRVVEIALSQHGTRALQKIIERISTPEQVNLLVSALDGSVVRIIRDIHGNHVIQKCLVELDADGVQFIYESVYCNVISVGTHRYGCCVLQRCLDNASSANRRLLVSQIVTKAVDLVCDPFGNYVCQYVLDLHVPDYTFGMASQFLSHLEELSMQKFSSNVIEKLLTTADDDPKSEMIKRLMAPCTLQKLLLDPYGNYVIQTVLEVSSGPTREAVADAVHKCLFTTRTPYGRRISTKLKALAKQG